MPIFTVFNAIVQNVSQITQSNYRVYSLVRPRVFISSRTDATFTSDAKMCVKDKNFK